MVGNHRTQTICIFVSNLSHKFRWNNFHSIPWTEGSLLTKPHIAVMTPTPNNTGRLLLLIIYKSRTNRNSFDLYNTAIHSTQMPEPLYFPRHQDPPLFPYRQRQDAIPGKKNLWTCVTRMDRARASSWNVARLHGYRLRRRENGEEQYGKLSTQVFNTVREAGQVRFHVRGVSMTWIDFQKMGPKWYQHIADGGVNIMLPESMVIVLIIGMITLFSQMPRQPIKAICLINPRPRQCLVMRGLQFGQSAESIRHPTYHLAHLK